MFTNTRVGNPPFHGKLADPNQNILEAYYCGLFGDLSSGESVWFNDPNRVIPSSSFIPLPFFFKGRLNVKSSK